MPKKLSIAGASRLNAATLANLEQQILFLRGQKAMLSTDLGKLYEVEPRVLNQAVKRSLERFPEDFMFQLTHDEFANLKSQSVISSWGGSRALPYAFTEQGVAMLSRSCLIYAFAAPNGSVRPASIAGPMGRVVAFRRFMRQLLVCSTAHALFWSTSQSCVPSSS